MQPLEIRHEHLAPLLGIGEGNVEEGVGDANVGFDEFSTSRFW